MAVKVYGFTLNVTKLLRKYYICIKQRVNTENLEIMKKTFILMIVALMSSLGVVKAQENSDLKPLEETAFAGEYYDLSKRYYTRNSSYDINKDGSISGNIISLHENGKLDESGHLREGHKHGKWLKYNEEGVRTSEANYVNGMKDGMWFIWDDNGTLRMEMHYDKGKRVGTWKFYDENGDLLDKKSF
jgi:antitoxin component YwqK of YwqJK toxin-antitoxin module